MRELKFKAKRIDNGEWFIFSLFDGVSKITWEIYDKATVCQFTGITDSQGNDIYEGDEIYVAGVGTVFVDIRANGAIFGAYEYLYVLEDIERLTGKNIKD